MSRDQEFHRRLVEASRDGLWVIELDGTTSFCNDAMAAYLGRPVDEVLGHPVEDFFDEQGRADLIRHLEELAAAPDDDPGSDNHEVQVLRPDGEVAWLLVSHSPIRDEAGHRTAWLHRVTENTEQKRLHDALASREALLAAAQEIAAIGSWEWEVATDTVTWSDQLYRIYNVSPEEFEATYAAFLEFIHPDDRAMVEQAVASTFAGADEFAWDGRVIPRGGDVRWVRGLGRVERAPDGTPTKMGGTAQDITERVLADRQAAEATRRLHLLQTMASAANQTDNLEEAVALAGAGLPEFTTWLGIADFRYDADGALLTTNDLSTLGEGWRPPPDPFLAERCRTTREMVHRPAPGRESTHSIVAFPVLLEGLTTCVIEVLADEMPPDANSRTLVEQISQQLSQVAGREASRTALAEARDQAMEASRLKSEFLATMSHEIRTPMNGVIGLNDLLLRTDLDAHQRRLAEGLQGAGLTLMEIINDILDLSKIEAGKLELEEVDFDVRAVFEKTADLLSGRAHEKGLELVVACHPDVPQFLRGDPGRFGQVLSNLGSNAVKFTERGEVAIQARVEEQDDERVVLRVDVSDTGVGIDPAQSESLFDAFTQADPSTTREHGGTGLGLAISRQLTAMLGGSIWVDSTSDRGSTFSFTVTMGLAEAPTESSTTEVDPQILRGRRVLVVDDNATNRLILDEQLTAWEMGPVSVGTAEDAMTALRSASASGEPFEVVVLDLLLPDGDGLALARAITAGSPGSPPRLVLLSSSHDVDQASVRAAGIRVSLTKPVRQSELFDAMVSALATGVAVSSETRAPATPAVPGRRILVVEDNQVNQMVAVGLLENAGYVADVVGDGQEAVEALRGEHGYAAVLMDCRMPVLDGFDATRAIRRGEPAGTRVPIIAMTASALEGEHERCLAAGMDDFLTKPVDPVRLLRVVRRWANTAMGPAPATPSSTPPPPAPPAASPASAEVTDRARMKMLDDMRRDGTSLFQRAAANFADNAPAMVDEVRGAVEAEDAAALAASAHKLRGSATNLGLPALGEAARALEATGAAGATHGAGTLLAALEAEMARALEALDSVRRDGP